MKNPNYSPPFNLTEKMIKLAALITELVEQVGAYKSFENKPKLRRDNRIRSIHSSLAIEANSLSLKKFVQLLTVTQYSNREEKSDYYNAISKSHRQGKSNVFVEFTLEKIFEVLREVAEVFKRA